VTTEWEQVQTRLEAGDFMGLAGLLRELSEAERKVLAAPLKAFEQRERRFETAILPFNYRSGLTLAGAGVLPTASALAPWVRRYGLFNAHNPEFTVADLTSDLLRARGVPWLGELARRLAEIRDWPADLLRLIVELVRISGIDPPATDALVAAWASANRGIAPGEVGRDWDPIILRTFEVDGVGHFLDVGDGAGLGHAIATFAAEGRFDRDEVIDRCLAALQRGGRLQDARGYLNVYSALEPRLPEVVARLRDYVPLLAGAHSTVAGMAQRELFGVDDAGQLETGELLEASKAAFARSEKKLVRAQLDRLRIVLARAPESADDFLRTLATVFDHGAADLQEQALDLALAHAQAASAETREQLAAAGTGLPADVRARAATAVGSADSPIPTVAAVLPGPPSREIPPPIESAAELAEEIAAMSAGGAQLVDPVRFERVLAGLVTLAYRDRGALADGLRPVRRMDEEIDWDRWLLHQLSEHSELAFAILVAGIPSRAAANAPYPDLDTFAGERGWQQKLSQSYGRRPYTPSERPGILMYRLHEITVGLVHAPRPLLVATPTASTGLLDPRVLLDRLAQAARQGWEPWQHDLTQALLRLPAACDTSLAHRARSLGTAAGDRLARWLEDDNPDRISALLPILQRGWLEGFGIAAEFRSCWPAVLPADRDVVARHLLSDLRHYTLRDRGGGRLLIALAEADGPVHDATLEAFAYGLNAASQEDRAGAVDALLVLAARRQLDGAAFGRRIGELAITTQLMTLGRIVPCLDDLARSGAAAQAWEVVAAALPSLISPSLGRPPHGLADLLELGVRLAHSVHPTSDIPHLTEVASRRGSSRIVTQARRLAAELRRVS
jgi:hypothetical protein